MGEREIIKCCFIKEEAVCKLLSLVTLSRSPPKTDHEGQQPSPALVSCALPPLGAQGGDGDALAEGGAGEVEDLGWGL